MTDMRTLHDRARKAWEHAGNHQPPWLTPAEIAAGEWGELRKEDAAYELAQLEDREEKRAS